MDERRQDFRIKNVGQINGTIGKKSITIIEISSGALVIKKGIELPKNGTVTINISTFTLTVHYDIIRMDKENMVLVFKDKEESNKIFKILKQIKEQS